MKTTKTCPQCATSFEGRSNQIYCASTCKQRTFQAGKSQRNAEPTSPSPALPEPLPVYPPPLSAQTVQVMETIRIKNAKRMKRLELGEREKLREAELKWEEREFDKERERAEWQREALKIQVAHRPTDTPLSGKPGAGNEKKAAELDSADEGTSELSVNQLLAIGLGGLLLVSLFRNQTPPPPTTTAFPLPPKPPLPSPFTTAFSAPTKLPLPRPTTPAFPLPLNPPLKRSSFLDFLKPINNPEKTD